MRSWRNWQTRTVQVRVGNRGGSNPLDRTKIKMTGSPVIFFMCKVIRIEIRTRKGITVKRTLPVEVRVGDGASSLKEDAQHGGLHCRP